MVRARYCHEIVGCRLGESGADLSAGWPHDSDPAPRDPDWLVRIREEQAAGKVKVLRPALPGGVLARRHLRRDRYGNLVELRERVDSRNRSTAPGSGVAKGVASSTNVFRTTKG